jgi:hypothetical protein
MEHKTQTIATLANFLYSLNLHIRIGELMIFIHNLETRFLLEVSIIIGSALWFIVNCKKNTTC